MYTLSLEIGTFRSICRGIIDKMYENNYCNYEQKFISKEAIWMCKGRREKLKKIMQAYLVSCQCSGRKIAK